MFIKVEHLVKKVTMESHTLTILQDISFDIEQGDSLAIVGVSGSGKTTLLGLLAGLDIPTSGRVIFQGINLNNLDENGRAKLRLHNVGFIFQNFQLIPTLTALENVLLPLELKGIKKSTSQAKSLLERVGLKHRWHHTPTQLSGGEQQRVAIARAFAGRPKILFADEPTANLDQATAETIAPLLFELNEDYHTTLVCVTHDPLLGNQCARVLQLSAGRIMD